MVCTSWKKGLRRIWYLPHHSHSNLLPILSDSLPIFYLSCHCSVNFLQKCVSSDSLVVKFISFHGIFLDVLSHRCVETSYFVVNGITLQCLILFMLIITSLHAGIITLNDDLISRVSMSAEVLFIRDGSYVLSGFDLQDSELRTYINYLSRRDRQMHIILIYYNLI